MKTLNVIFSIVEEKNCPLYRVGEALYLSEKTFSCPANKEVCLILVRDMTELLFRLLHNRSMEGNDGSDPVYNCSGCRGLIKFSRLSPDQPHNARVEDGSAAKIDSGELKMSRDVTAGSFLQALPPEHIETIIRYFKEITIEEGRVLIKKGEANINLYLVSSGELLVEDGSQQTTIKAGELCGEISYLGADAAVATVRAIKQTKVLAIGGDVFGRLFDHNPAVQSFMAKLLAARLRKTSEARTRDLEAAMSGKIDEIVPAELFQIFHMHQKTGVLSMDLSLGLGKVSFREGCIINACYGEWQNENAIFKILSEKKGHYRFTSGLLARDMRAAEIGDFMSLLMEGVKRIDEEHGR